MPGGVIRGYWATGREYSAIPPIRVITTESTVAKIGRSMKNFEIMDGAGSAGTSERDCSWPPPSLVAAGAIDRSPPVSPLGGGLHQPLLPPLHGCDRPGHCRLPRQRKPA